MKNTFFLSAFIVMLIAFPISSNAAVRYDGGVAQSGNGTSWAQAVKTIQEGVNGDGEVWVKMGTYQLSTYISLGSTSIYGGFNGTEVQRDHRDWVNNVTIIDGSIVKNNAIISVVGNAIIDGLTITGGGVHPSDWSV